ncbi:MAG: PA2169 family four-helix-bundle protein [Thermoguttaceae bacterium]|jgi:uncharacterized protein (TIGR02284 family)
MTAIQPHSLDPQTIERLRDLVAATYTGRDDLYRAAANLEDSDLSAICHKLADELAGNSAHLSQILAMHGTKPHDAKSVTAVLTEEIMRFLREHEHDKGILSAANKVECGLRERYDTTIAATENAETQALLKKQREDVEFGEKVLRQIAKAGSGDSPPSPK